MFATMGLDSDIVASFKATGTGWQIRVNGALRLFLAPNNLLMQRGHVPPVVIENMR